MALQRIRRFDRDLPPGEAGRPSHVLAGDPTTMVQNLYSGAGNRLFAGFWESTPGKWQISYSEHEFCMLLQGRVVLTAEDGAVERFGPGDAFVIPAGFRGSWETVEPVRKLYVIYEPHA